MKNFSQHQTPTASFKREAAATRVEKHQKKGNKRIFSAHHIQQTNRDNKVKTSLTEIKPVCQTTGDSIKSPVLIHERQV